MFLMVVFLYYAILAEFNVSNLGFDYGCVSLLVLFTSLVVIYFGGLLVFSLFSLEIVNMLMVMEYMMLVVFAGLVFLVCVDSFMVFVVYMVIVVCEACLGLGLLVLGVIINTEEYCFLGDLLK